MRPARGSGTCWGVQTLGLGSGPGGCLSSDPRSPLRPSNPYRPHQSDAYTAVKVVTTLHSPHSRLVTTQGNVRCSTSRLHQCHHAQSNLMLRNTHRSGSTPPAPPLGGCRLSGFIPIQVCHPTPVPSCAHQAAHMAVNVAVHQAACHTLSATHYVLSPPLPPPPSHQVVLLPPYDQLQYVVFLHRMSRTNKVWAWDGVG